MAKLICVNDPHYSRSEPECRAPSYPQEILEKLHAAARLAKRIGAPAIACTGDWLHRKGRATFQEQNDLLALLSGWRAAGIRPIGILGNHDIPGTSLEAMEVRAAGAFYRAGVLQLLDFDPAYIEDPDGILYVTGTSYFHGCDSSDEARVRMYGAPPSENPNIRGRTLHVHLAHGALMLNGEFVEDFSTPEQLVPLLHAAGRLPDVIVCGHLHFPEETRRLPRPDGRGEVAFVRAGSVGRTASNDLERIPQAVAIASAGREYVIKTVPIGKPALPAVDLPKDDPRDPREHEQRIREFARKLREEAEVLSLEDNEKLIRTAADRLGHGERVVARVLRAIGEVKT